MSGAQGLHSVYRYGGVGARLVLQVPEGAQTSLQSSSWAQVKDPR